MGEMSVTDHVGYIVFWDLNFLSSKYIIFTEPYHTTHKQMQQICKPHGEIMLQNTWQFREQTGAVIGLVPKFLQLWEQSL